MPPSVEQSASVPLVPPETPNVALVRTLAAEGSVTLPDTPATVWPERTLLARPLVAAAEKAETATQFVAPSAAQFEGAEATEPATPKIELPVRIFPATKFASPATVKVR